MRILVFNRSYHPDVEATGQLLTELCTDLAVLRDVRVIVGQPNFVPLRAGGLLEESRYDGVAITRVRNLRFSKKSLLGRAFGLISYLLLALWAGLRARRPHVIIVETDPPFLGLLGAFLGRWHRCPFIYYLQDLFPEVGLALGQLRPGLLTKFLYWATQTGMRRADRVIVLGEDMQARVASRGIAPERIIVVPNWADTSLIYPRSRTNPWGEPAPQDDSMVVMYSGNLGLSQNLDQLLEAARDLASVPIRFLIIGEGAAKASLVARAKTWGLANVRFLSYQAKDRLGESLAAADIHFIPLRRGLAGAIVPSKLYGILAAGVPFIAAVEPASEVARVAQVSGAGLLIPPDSPAELVQALRWCLENRARLPAMGKRGRHAAETEYSRHVCVGRIDEIITSVARRGWTPFRVGPPSSVDATTVFA